jgi:hypothetical protein
VTEAYVQTQVLTRLRAVMRSAFIVKHADKFTFGVPDISVTDNKLTSWWELKFADPGFDSHATQREAMKKLERVGHCARYVIFDMHDEGRGRATYLVKPSLLDTFRLDGIRKQGFDYEWVINSVISTHYRRSMNV